MFCLGEGRYADIPQRDRFCLYGGAGWGGKSHCLRTAAFEFAMYFRDQGIKNPVTKLFCSTYPDLMDRQISKFETEFEGFGYRTNSQTYGLHWRFPADSGLGVVQFRNIVSSTNSSRNKGTRRGAEGDAGLVEELTELTYSQFTAVTYQVRPRNDSAIHTPILANTNPDGIGHQWVKKVFVEKDTKHDFYRAVDARQVFYVPAKKQDNPAYAVQAKIIDGRMAMIEDPAIRAARDDGSWDIYSSGRFPHCKDFVHGFEWADFFAENGMERMDPLDFLAKCTSFGFIVFGSLDFGTSNSSISAYYLHLVGPDDRVWTFACLRMSGMTLELQAFEILAFEKGMKVTPSRRFGDPQSLARRKEDDKRDRGGKTAQDRFRAEGVAFVLADNDRSSGATTVSSMLDWSDGRDGRPLKKPRWRIHRGEKDWEGCSILLDLLPTLPRRAIDPEDVDPMGGIFHDYDSARYFLHTQFGGGTLDRPQLELLPGYIAHALLTQPTTTGLQEWQRMLLNLRND